MEGEEALLMTSLRIDSRYIYTKEKEFLAEDAVDVSADELQWTCLWNYW